LAEAVLETGRLQLRPPCADDLPWLLESMNTFAVLRHLGGQIRSASDVASGLEADIAAFSSGGHRRWTVWRLADNLRIGRCGLFHLLSDAAPVMLRGADEIGWTFAEPFWGQGYASEAARAVIAHFFADPKNDVLWSQTSDSNPASTRMMARLGFSRQVQLDYVDPDYPPQDNPTTVYRKGRGDWAAAA
jgi:RimJ/RimL family protein N-acetyltransferase